MTSSVKIFFSGTCYQFLCSGIKEVYVNMAKYAIHPDFRICKINAPFNKFFLFLASPVMKFALKLTRVPTGISAQRFTVRGFQNLKIPVDIFIPDGCDKKAPCLLYFHGGGFGFNASPYHKKIACRYALNAKCKVVFPYYHLLPRFPFPAARDDAIAVYSWLIGCSENLGIDTRRIAVGGDSAGGVLAAYVCNLAPCFDLPQPCLQMLIYPVTDMLMSSESMKRFQDTPMWNSKRNKNMWQMYLKNTPQNQWSNASPMQMSLPLEIPDTYIEAAEFDCLRDDSVSYASRLQNAGGKVTFIQTYGTVHGYDIVQNSSITKESMQHRFEALHSAFEK